AEVNCPPSSPTNFSLSRLGGTEEKRNDKLKFVGHRRSESMKTAKTPPKTGALGVAIALTILAIAIASLGYGWHRVVSAQAGDKSDLTPDVVTITEYPLPNPSPAARPFGIARRSSDHSMWFAEPATGKIGRITQDGTITE